MFKKFYDYELVPSGISKDKVLFEIESVINAIKGNLYFNNISLKSISYNDKNFLTPKLQILFSYLNIQSFIIKEIISVRFIIIIELFWLC
jgi:hypothetical protein